MKTKIFLLLPFLFLACVTATVGDSLTLDKTFTYNLPTVQAYTATPVYTTTLTQSAPIDVSDAVSKLSSLGSLSLSVASSTLSSNVPLSFITHIDISLTEASDTTPLTVVDTDIASSAGDILSLPVLADSNDLLTYLGAGQNTLTVTLTVSTVNGGTLPSDNQLNMDYTLSLNASEMVHKSL
jgi:hypothetical protein